MTGASGFIGVHLVSSLVERGDDVTCLVRRTSNVEWLKPYSPRFVYGDVTAPDGLNEAVRGKDVVYHLAGCTMATRRRVYFDVNQTGVRNIASACATQTTPPVLMSVSSLAAVGPTRDGAPLCEAERPRPVSHYGRSKRAGELEAEALSDRVPISVVRPPIVLGEYDRMGLQMFWGMKRFHVHVVPSLARYRYSLIHARDLANLFILAAERGKRLPSSHLGGTGGRPGQGYYFAACEYDPLYGELGDMVATALGRKRALCIHLAVPIVWAASFCVEASSQIQRRPMYLLLDKTREITAGAWICSAKAAADDLGFRVGASIQDRLNATAEWYLKEGWL